MAKNPRAEINLESITDAYKSFEANANTDYAASQKSDLSVAQLNSQTTVRLPEDALKDCSMRESRAGSNEGEATLVKPTHCQVSQQFTLNERQHIAFVLAGSYLLDSFKRAEKQLKPGKPLRMHIAGEGGTGTSRVVEALVYLSKAWGRPKGVVTVAPTRIAAVHVIGETAHSNFKTMKYFKPSLSDIEDWEAVYMVIWDEISMAEQKLLVKSFENLRKILGTLPGEEFRVHFEASGDFLQLPPCCGGYIFEAPIASKNLFEADELLQKRYGKSEKSDCFPKHFSNATTIVNIDAFQIWRSFDTVIRLENNMRHKKDPMYGLLLQRLRLGTHTLHNIENLNIRPIDLHGSDERSISEF